MGAKLRSEIFSPEEQAVVHVMNRCVQQRFLLGFENETGKQFGHRRHLDERALLTCSMYVDLNRIQAELAASLEESDYTSIQRRLQAFAIRTAMRHVVAEQVSGCKQSTSIVNTVVLDASESQVPESLAADQPDVLPDAHLSPIQIDENNDPIGPHLSRGDSRCSDKGYLPMSIEKYIELLRWTTDQIRHRAGGKNFEDTPQILAELELEADTWCKLTTQFTELFFVAAGMPGSVDAHRSCGTDKRFHMPKKTREMLSA